MDVLVSVIVPVYNAELILDKCIDSIRNQSIKNIEIILVNDNSLDRSLEICLKHQKEDYRIKVIDNVMNKGVSYSRNVGINNCSGKYITFIDSDDWIELNHLKNMVEPLENNYDMSITNASVVHKNKVNSKVVNGYIPSNLSCHDSINYLFLNKGYKGFSWNKMYKANIICENNIRFNENIFYCEDTLFVVEYLSYCNDIYYNDSVTYNYYINGNNVVLSKINEKKMSFIEAYNNMKNFFKGDLAVVRMIELDFVLNCISLIVNEKKYTEDIAGYLKVLQKNVRKHILKFLIDKRISYKVKLYSIIISIDLKGFIFLYNFGRRLL